MYGIFTNICPKNHPNVGKYTIHGSYGLDFIPMKPEPDPHVTSNVSNGSHPADPPFLLTPMSGYSPIIPIIGKCRVANDPGISQGLFPLVAYVYPYNPP